MLDLPRYLLGAAEVLALAGFATLGASALRARLLPSFTGAPAHLATAVLALAILIWAAELLGSFGLLQPLPYLALVVLAGLGAWRAFSGEKPSKREGRPHPLVSLPALIALGIAAIALAKFGLEVKPKLSTGMTGFDSTWYHGPFAAGFFQSGSTWDPHYIAPQFLAWFYPANAELFHGVGMLAFGRDVLSPILNLGWFAGCLVACWCIGRPYRVAPWSLALGAIALSLPFLSDQAGEARNDVVGTFFLLAAVAIALNARPVATASAVTYDSIGHKSHSGALVVGLAAGLAAGTKLNFLLPAAVLVLGLGLVAPAGARLRSFALGTLAAVAGGGYWYLRNLVQSGGNPLPWFDSLGPIALPAPDQALGGREGHSVLGYLFDAEVWSEWLLPGLREGLTVLWPLFLGLALAGAVLALAAARPRTLRERGADDCDGDVARGDADRDSLVRADRQLAVAGATALATALAWLVAPTSASGPEGMPRGFESGLRYLAPALVLGFALLPTAARLRGRLGSPTLSLPVPLTGNDKVVRWGAWVALPVLLAVAIGYPVQRHYLESRYSAPTFADPGLNAAFEWATPLSGARIATTGTRQYPLFGTDLTNRVQFVGEEQPHGGFVAPSTCRRWRELLNEGRYDYVVATRDRKERGKPPYPPTSSWTKGPGVTAILREPPTVVFRLTAPVDPLACSR